MSGSPKEDVRMRVGEGPKTISAMKMLFIARGVSSGVKKKLFERVVLPTLTYGAET